jgi:hypothetical protein
LCCFRIVEIDVTIDMDVWISNLQVLMLGNFVQVDVSAPPKVKLFKELTVLCLAALRLLTLSEYFLESLESEGVF